MTNYPNPFIPQRADPYIVKGPDNFYYFTASYPALYDVDHGYDRIILRRSRTVSGLVETGKRRQRSGARTPSPTPSGT